MLRYIHQRLLSPKQTVRLVKRFAGKSHVCVCVCLQKEISRYTWLLWKTRHESIVKK